MESVRQIAAGDTYLYVDDKGYILPISRSVCESTEDKLVYFVCVNYYPDTSLFQNLSITHSEQLKVIGVKFFTEVPHKKLIFSETHTITK